MLNFQPLSLGLKALADSYTFKYGEGSCQHSFVSSWCLRQKYGDEFCEHDGSLYILRSKLCSESERVYLFPLGARDNTDALRQALQNVIDDAHENGAKVAFRTLTAEAKDMITSMFPEKFSVEASRDYTEYLYRIDKMVDLPGHEFASRRKKIVRFFRYYGERCLITFITEEYMRGIRHFQNEWLNARLAENDNDPSAKFQLEQDNDGVMAALEDFFRLGLSGIVLLIDGEVRGFEYGSPLSEDCFDAMAEKGDRSIPSIYRVLNHEFLRLCCNGYKLVNWEEDLGSDYLRNMKTRYNPDVTIEKFIVREK